MQIGGTYIIDFAKVSKIPKFNVNIKNGDDKRTIKLILLKNNEVLNLKNYNVVVAAKKSDGTDIFNDVKIIDAETGICEVEISEQMLALGTDLPCEIILYGLNRSVASSSNFVISVLPSVKDSKNIVSSNEFTALTKALSDIVYVKNDISKKADKTQTNNLQSQINTLVVNGTGNSNPEVLQARVNVTGVEFGTLSERNLFVENTLNGSEFPISWSSWEEGGINTNTGIDTPVSGYIRTKGYLSFEGLKTVKCNLTNCKIFILEYSRSNKTFIKSSEKTSNFTLISLDNFYRFVVIPLTSGDLNASNFFSMLGSYTFDEIDSLKTKTSIVPSVLDSCNKFLGDVSLKETLKWEIGGIIGSSGENISNNYSIRSDFFTFNTEIEATSIKDFYCISYEQNGDYLSRINPKNNKISLTDLSKKYRFVFSNDIDNTITDIESVLSFIEIKSKPVFKTKVLEAISNNNLSKSNLKGKIINCLGDSITSTDYSRPTWWELIAERTGARFNNNGISGTCIGYNTDREQRFGKCFCNRYQEMDKNADAVVVMGGTNDYEIKLGTWNDTTIETFYGSLNVLMKGLLETYKGKPIIFMTPIQQANDYINNIIDPVTPIQSNANSSIQLQLRAEAIKRKCMQYGITCIDLYSTSGINGADSGKIYYRSGDITHPSAYGQKVIANNLLPILESKFMF